MHKRDIVNDTKVTAMLAPAVRTADASAVQDRKGFGTLAILFAFGIEGVTLSGTDKIEATLEDSDDNATWANVGDEDVVLPANAPTGAQLPGSGKIVFVADGNADIPATVLIGYRGSKRYVRAGLDFAGTHGTGTPTAIHSIMGGPDVAPVS